MQSNVDSETLSKSGLSSQDHSTAPFRATSIQLCNRIRPVVGDREKMRSCRSSLPLLVPLNHGTRSIRIPRSGVIVRAVALEVALIDQGRQGENFGKAFLA